MLYQNSPAEFESDKKPSRSLNKFSYGFLLPLFLYFEVLDRVSTVFIKSPHKQCQFVSKETKQAREESLGLQLVMCKSKQHDDVSSCVGLAWKVDLEFESRKALLMIMWVREREYRKKKKREKIDKCHICMGYLSIWDSFLGNNMLNFVIYTLVFFITLGNRLFRFWFRISTF